MTEETGSNTAITAPLSGVRVVEVGQLLAGPFAGTLLGYFGADVIKVEPPGSGDPIRGWRLLDETGTAYWWRSLGRNKRSLTLDLRSEEGRRIAGELIDGADVVIENFRPGTMEKWGLGPERFQSSNPALIYTRISGYGQSGPLARKPGYASVTEAYSGFRYVNGHAGEAPIRPNLSIGDTLSGMHAAFGIALALLARQKIGRGQVVDVALFESMFNLLEGVIPEYSGAAAIREPSGSTITGIVPTNTYKCADGRFVVIGGNGDSIFKRLMRAIDRDDLADDPRLAHNPGRVEHETLLDDAIGAWTRRHDAANVIDVLEAADVPVGPILNVADMFNEPQFRARGLFESVTINGKPLEIPALLPKLDATPGTTRWPGGDVGTHRDEVLTELGYSAEDIARLEQSGIV